MGTISISELIDSVVNYDKNSQAKKLSELMTAYGVKTPNELLAPEMPLQIREQAGNLIKGALQVDMPRTEVGGGMGLIPGNEYMSSVSPAIEPMPSSGGFAINQPKASFVTPPPSTMADFQKKLTGAEAQMTEPYKKAQIAGTIAEIRKKEEDQSQNEMSTGFSSGLNSLVQKYGVGGITTEHLTKLNSDFPGLQADTKMKIAQYHGVTPKEVRETEQINQVTLAIKNGLTRGDNVQDPIWQMKNVLPLVPRDSVMAFIDKNIPPASKPSEWETYRPIFNKFLSRGKLTNEEITLLTAKLNEGNPMIQGAMNTYDLSHSEIYSGNPTVQEKALRDKSEYLYEFMKRFNYNLLGQGNPTPATQPAPTPAPIKIDQPVPGQVYREKPKSSTANPADFFK